MLFQYQNYSVERKTNQVKWQPDIELYLKNKAGETIYSTSFIGKRERSSQAPLVQNTTN